MSMFSGRFFAVNVLAAALTDLQSRQCIHIDTMTTMTFQS